MVRIIGLGLGGGFGGGVDSAFTQVGIVGGDDLLNWLNRFATGYERVDVAQGRANRSAEGYMRSLQRLNSLMPTARLGGFSTGGGALSLGMTGVTGSMIALGVTSIKAANDVVESESLVAEVYGRNTQKIKDWSEERRKALGVNSYEQRRVAAGFAIQFESAGMNPEKARELSKAFTEARDDLVSLYNVKDPNDAFRALQSGIAGEVEPLRRFSLFVSEAATKEYALRKGIVETNRELTDQEKVLSRAGLILEQFNKGKAKGNLALTKDSPVNQWRRVQNERAMAQVQFGQTLQPIQDDALKIANNFLPIIGRAVNSFASLDNNTRQWIIRLGLAGAPLIWLTGKSLALLNLWKQFRTPALTAGGIADALSKGKGGLGVYNVGLMRVNAGSVLITGPTIVGGGGFPGIPVGTLPRGPMPKGPLALPPGAAPRALPGLGWQLRTLLGIGGAQAVLANAKPLFQMHAPGALAAGRAALPTATGVGLAARSLTPWGIGIGVGVAGAEGIRRYRKSRGDQSAPDSLGEMAGNAGRRLLDVGKIGYSGVKRIFTGEELRGWDSTRNQFQSDSEAQMADASKKYQADVKDAHAQADAWAMKHHRSVEERDVKFWQIMAEREKHWAMEYARNKSLAGYQTHANLRRQAQQNVTQSTLKYLDASLERWKDQNRPGWRENEALGMNTTQRTAKRDAQRNVLKAAGYSDKRIAREMDESAQGARAREIERQRDYLKRTQTVMERVPGSRTGEVRQVQRRLSQSEQQAELQRFAKQYDDEHGTAPKEKARHSIWDRDTANVASLFGMGPKEPVKAKPLLTDTIAQRFGAEPVLADVRGSSAGLMDSVRDSGGGEYQAQGTATRGRDDSIRIAFAPLVVPAGRGDNLARDIEHENRTPMMPMP